MRVSWQASSDNVGVAGYRVFRNGTQVGSANGTSYTDSGLQPATTYSYRVSAFDASNNASAASGTVNATTQSAGGGGGNVIVANPTNYLSLISSLRPGDTLLLQSGNYGVTAGGADTGDVPGLPLFDVNGTASAPITITGPDSGAKPVLLGRATHNTVRLANSSYVVVRNIEIDNRGLGAAAVASQGTTHHITIENLYIHGVDDDQQTVGIAVQNAAWNWVIRRNTIVGAGTGMYLGSSTGNAQFVGGLIENNLVRDTIGYNIEIKHQNQWPATLPAGMPTGATPTIVRNNVFSKLSSFVSSYGARPNLLVGDHPPSGPGSQNSFEIYGNFFYRNPTEVLFQGEGNIAFHHNLLFNDVGTALRVQRHNGSVRTVRIFANTVVARDTGISVTGGQAGSTQRVFGNAVFAGSPVSVSGADASASDNVTGSQAAATNALVNASGALGQLDLYPKSGQLQGVAPSTAGLAGYLDWDRDFNGGAHAWTTRGAYSGTGSNPGWRLQLEIKP